MHHKESCAGPIPVEAGTADGSVQTRSDSFEGMLIPRISRPVLWCWMLVLACFTDGSLLAASADSVTTKSFATTKPLWNVPELTQPCPPVRYGPVSGLTQEVWYEGEQTGGKPTRIFAYLGMPVNVSSARPAPAILLVHGGGGKAFREWAEHWAGRGYVALAMDTAGQDGDGRRHDQAGPDQSDDTRFRNFTAAEAREMWSYHAVAAVLRGHGLLKSLPEVDRERVGITGISWGGYLTCLVAGLDPGLKVAVPVYGCGFLGENSVWRDGALAAMNRESRERWLTLFDPATVVGQTRCPVLFLTGMHDFAFPPDSYRKTYMLVPSALRTLSIRVDLPHGHYWNFPEVDAFVDHALGGTEEHGPLARLSEISTDGTSATARLLAGGPVARAELHYTAMTDSWTSRTWTTRTAAGQEARISAPLPPERPLTFFFTVADSKGLITSTPYAELPKADR